VADHVNMHDAKTHFSRLVERAEAGEEIVIARAGTPVAKLVHYDAGTPERRPGAWAGQVRIHDDFDELPAEIADAFEGRES
jgi:prevent-host-death family protein